MSARQYAARNMGVQSTMAFSTVRFVFPIVAVVAPLVLTSCATLNEEECITTNWRDLGVTDGQAGRPQTYVKLHRDACGKHGLPVDEQSWRDGWEVGIRSYCTPQTGLREGREGRSYSNSCPPDVAPGFENAYEVGRRVHDARAERDRIQREIDSLLANIGKTESKDERRALRTRISSLETQLYIAEGRIREAELAYDRYVSFNGLAG